MKKELKCYYVTVYQISIKCPDDFYTYVWPCAKMLVWSYKRKNNKKYILLEECKEVLEDFDVPVVGGQVSREFDAEMNGYWYKVELPKDFNREHEYFVLEGDFYERNIATFEDIKKYNPQETEWYKYFKGKQYIKKKKEIEGNNKILSKIS